jgi:hypothetical protein
MAADKHRVAAMKHSVFGLMFAAFSIAPLAHAEGPSTGAAPYKPWTAEEAFPAPRPIARRSAPGPLSPEPELARSVVELVAGAGPVFGWCFGGSTMSFPCRALEPGLGASVSGLWRVSPFFGWGGRASASLFSYEPPLELDAERTHALVGAVEIMARVYSSEQGVIDPYAELGLGAAVLRASLSARTGADTVHSAYAPSTHVGGGLDFVLGRNAKVGLAAAFNQVFVPALRRCPAHGDGRCVAVEGSDRGYVSSTLELGARFTLMLGNEL